MTSEIREKVFVTTNELINAYNIFREQREVEYWTAQTLREANSLIEDILNSKSVKYKSESKLLEYGESLEEIEEAVYNLKTGEISKPILVDSIYYIFKLTKQIPHPGYSGYDLSYWKESIEKRIRERKEKNLLDNKLSSLMLGKDFTVNRDSYNFLYEQLVPIIYGNNNIKTEAPEIIQNEIGLKETGGENDFNQSLIQFNDGSVWTVEEFWKMLSVSPYPLNYKNPADLRIGLMDVIKKTVLLISVVDDAVKKNYYESKYSKAESQMWRTNILASALMEKYRGEININEEEITWQKRVRTISTKKSVFTDSVTGKKFIAGTIRDITDRRKAEEERHRLATAIEHAAESVIITDKEATIQYVNPAYKKITGYRRNEIIGKKFNILQKGKHNESFYEDMWETIKNGFVWSGHFINTKKDGTPYEVEVSISPIRDSNKNIISYVAVKRDITKEMKLQKEMRQSQKMEALGTLAGGIAHDFNNILMLILGYTALVMKDISEETITYKNLKQIIKAGNRAKDLVKQILAFSRQSEQEKKPVNINPIIKETLKLLRSSLPSTIEIQRNIKANSTIVMADPTQIHQVMMNLCTNSSHAMKENGGTLKVTLTDLEITKENANLYQVLEEGQYVKLTVSDTGHGMEESIIERIFEPYFTTKKPEEGTGLGLAVVHGIVKSHGGDITVESQPGRGTTFHIYLPSIKRDISPEVIVHQAVLRGNENILFVDDEKELIIIWKELLEEVGYKVTGISDVFDALDIFRKNPEKFDLVITDQTMPHMTGSELAKVLMSIKPDIPVILCTGFSEIISAKEAKSMGIKEFIMKPIDTKNITEIIRTILDEKNK